jgi:MFS superfamily sulfate permease-like transporter
MRAFSIRVQVQSSAASFFPANPSRRYGLNTYAGHRFLKRRLALKIRFSGRREGYNAQRFRKDVLAGVIVGIVALPLAMAFAIASGVSPERGLYTAIVAGAAISVFGGSRFQVGGPTGAMVAILLVILIEYGFNFEQGTHGQGIANCIASVFDGITATGAIAGSATNIRNGGNSPVAGVMHAVTLLVMMLVLAPWAGNPARMPGSRPRPRLASPIGDSTRTSETGH